jgi:hypothetical protein
VGRPPLKKVPALGWSLLKNWLNYERRNRRRKHYRRGKHVLD